MNAKQTIQAAPAIATIAATAPQLFLIGAVGCGIYFGLKWLFSADTEKKPEIKSSPAVPERLALPMPPISGGNPIQKSAVPINSGRNSAENHGIPANSAGKSTVTPAPPTTAAPLPVMSVPVMPKIPIPPSPAIPAVKIAPEISLPAQKKFISREDIAKIFNGRGRTRKSAVSALNALGFGKTAAYQALEMNGRFAQWLQFAPDGIITWKN